MVTFVVRGQTYSEQVPRRALTEEAGNLGHCALHALSARSRGQQKTVNGSCCALLEEAGIAGVVGCSVALDCSVILFAQLYWKKRLCPDTGWQWLRREMTTTTSSVASRKADLLSVIDLGVA